jgi:hypothetical protein
MFTQALLHAVAGALQAATQVPPWHAGVPPLHALASMPQLEGLVWRSTQLCPEGVRPGWQTQLPLWQSLLVLQFVPQSPQKFGSLFVSRQLPWQQVFALAGQALLQLPQLFGSLEVCVSQPAEAVQSL